MSGIFLRPHRVSCMAALVFALVFPHSLRAQWTGSTDPRAWERFGAAHIMNNLGESPWGSSGGGGSNWASPLDFAVGYGAGYIPPIGIAPIGIGGGTWQDKPWNQGQLGPGIHDIPGVGRVEITYSDPNTPPEDPVERARWELGRRKETANEAKQAVGRAEQQLADAADAVKKAQEAKDDRLDQNGKLVVGPDTRLKEEKQRQQNLRNQLRNALNNQEKFFAEHPDAASRKAWQDNLNTLRKTVADASDRVEAAQQNADAADHEVKKAEQVQANAAANLNKAKKNFANQQAQVGAAQANVVKAEEQAQAEDDARREESRREVREWERSAAYMKEKKDRAAMRARYYAELNRALGTHGYHEPEAEAGGGAAKKPAAKPSTPPKPATRTPKKMSTKVYGAEATRLRNLLAPLLKTRER